MPSKSWPTWDADLIRARMLDACRRKGLDTKAAAAAAGMSYWNWMKKQGGDAFTPEQCITFARAVGAPTMFPFYDWDFAFDIDKELGWGQ